MKTIKQLSTLFCLMISANMAYAYDFMVDGLCYDINTDGSSVTLTYQNSSSPAYSNLNGALTIPPTVTYSGKTYSVTTIGDYAFQKCKGLTFIDIPNSVTSIGSAAFYDCNGLNSVTIPNSVISIGEWAFSCLGLTSVTIGKSVKSIGYYAFSSCNNLTEVNWNAKNCSDLSGSPFYNLSKIKSFNFGNEVEHIPSHLCSSLSGLTFVSIPISVTSIGSSAFYECNGLTSVSIGNSVMEIGDYAFFGCSSLTSIVIPNSVTSIADGTFYGCSGLTSVTIPNSVTSIRYAAFFDCSRLTSVSIGNSVSSIGPSAFSGCKGLITVTIPISVTSIGNYAFSVCSSLKEVNWNARNCTDFTSSNNSAFSNLTSITNFKFGNEVEHIPAHLCTGLSSLTSVTIGNSVSSIGNYAFSGCGNICTLNIDSNKFASISSFPNSKTSLKTLTLGNSVTSIGDNAFIGCTGLTYVTIPNSVKSIGPSAFSGCTSLNSFTLPDAISSIGSKAFYNCSSLKSVRIPKTIMSMGNDAFSGCSNLNEIYYLGANTPFYIATTRTYVVDKTKFKTPQATIKTPYNIIQYVDFNNTTFAYSKHIPNVTYTNNLSDWNCNIISSPNQQDWDLSTGSHNVSYNFGFSKDGETFDVDIPFYYTITKKALTAKADNKTRFFGDDNPQFTISYEGFVDGEGLSSITTPPTASTTATKSSDVGSYPITLTGGSADNYTFTYQSGTLSVTKAPLEAKINDAQRIYGQANPAFSMTYTGLKNGETIPKWTVEPVYQTQAIQTSSVGAYPIYLESCEPKNYYLTSITKGTLTVSAKDLIIKANDASRPYGDDNPEFGFTCSGFVNGDDEQELSKLPTIQTNATKQSGVGNYDIIPLGAGARNYTISYQNGTLTVTKRPLTAKPTPISRYYGDPNPDLTIDYTSFVNGDDESSLASIPVASTTATTTSNVGSYAIKLTGGSATNYDITCENGTLTVVKAPVSITINDKERIYGDSNPSFTYTLQGLKNGETSPAWIVKPTLSTLATKTSPVGVYDINMNEPEANNYEISTVTNGKLTVKKATLTARANNASRLYFEDNPTFTCTYSGFKNGENSSVISKVPQIYTDAKKTTKAGQYPIFINWAEAQNYDFTYVDGTLNINKRTIVATTPNYSRLYQEPNPQFEVSYSGFVNDETINVFHMVPWVKCDAGYNANVGTYPIIIYNGEADNYNFDYRGGYLTVQKKEQTISWEQDLSNVELYCNLELAAHASSNLPITVSS